MPSGGQAHPSQFDLAALLADEGTETERSERYGTATGAIKGWEQFQQFVQALDRQDFPKSRKEILLRSALGKLSQAGLTLEAIAYINERFGPGQIRSAMVSRIIAKSALSVTDLAEIIGNLELPEDHAAALDGLVVRVRELDWADLRDGLGSTPDAALAKSFGSGIALRFAQPGVDIAEEELQFGRLSNEVSFQSEFIAGFLDYSSGAALEAMWDCFANTGSQWPPELRNRYLEKYARYDPVESLARIGSSKGDQVDSIETVVRVWLQEDSDAAARAFLGTPAGLDQFGADVGRLEILKYSVKCGELDSASKWLNLIASEGVRQKGEQLLHDVQK